MTATPRLDAREKLGPRAAPAAVAAHLEHARAQRLARPEHRGLRSSAAPRREDGGEEAPVDPEQERLRAARAVGLERVRLRLRRVEGGDQDRADPPAITPAESRPGNPTRDHRLEPCRPLTAVRDPHLADRHAGEQSRQAARVIRRAFGESEGREAPDPEAPQRGDDDALAPIAAPGPAATRVDEECRALRRLHEDRLALSHIEDDDTNEALRPRRPDGEGRGAADQRDQARGRPPAADPGQEDEHQPDHRHRRDGRRRQVDDRAGQRGGAAHGQAEEREKEPEALEQRVGERLADGGHRQGQHPARREERGERDDQEVGAHAERRELAEVEERHRRHPKLSSRRHGEGVRDRPRTPRRESRADPRPEMKEPGGCREGELEPRLCEALRVEGEQREKRRRETVPHAALAPEEARGEEKAAHDGGAEHRRLAAHDGGERDEGREREASGERRGEAHESEEQEHGARDQRDVEAGDRQHVIDARAAEVLEQGGRELPPLADQEPLEERARDRRRCRPMTAWIQRRVRSHHGSGTGGRPSRSVARAVAK